MNNTPNNSSYKNIARFAVVGHPNKGKSSIVSTLSQNDSIEISGRSGTTVHSDAYQVANDQNAYQLIDTPGFQRPHKVLDWLKERASSAEQRSKAVADFVADEQCRINFPDEVELLKPLVEGAAILYVVDGSRPYGSEYEAEMEILRWSGQPSMALINPIETTENVEPWKSALHQYFKLVRVFNPMDADFDKQLELLNAFSHLNPDWTKHLNTVIESLKSQRELQKINSATLLARLVEDLCFYQVNQKVLSQQQAELLKPVLEKQYIKWMIEREHQAISSLFANYKHFNTNLSIDDMQLPPNLFDSEQWYAWGLNKKELVLAATIAGAVAGAAVDASVAGASFMLGALGGSILGFTSAWFGADTIHQAKIKDLPMGGYEASYGPVNNKNFPYVIIGRFLFLYQQISQRNHAKRDQLKVESSELQSQINSLEKSSQKLLHQICTRLINQKSTDSEKLKDILSLLF
ncbi:MAG: GTPase Era involved in 16S rRNA processing [Enterobacterales bacterium]